MADYVLKTIPDLPSASSISDADKIIISQGGVTKQLDFVNLKGQSSDYGYITGIFHNSDLVNGILTINHAKNTRVVKCIIYDPSGILAIGALTKIVDENNISIDFGGIGGIIESGDWTYLVEFWGAGTSTAYPDPTYALADHNHFSSTNIMNVYGQDASIAMSEGHCYKDDHLIVGFIVAKCSVTNTDKFFGQITGGVPMFGGNWKFSGNPDLASDYESAKGYITQGANVYLNFGKANKNFIFNIIYPI